MPWDYLSSLQFLCIMSDVYKSERYTGRGFYQKKQELTNFITSSNNQSKFGIWGGKNLLV